MWQLQTGVNAFNQVTGKSKKAELEEDKQKFMENLCQNFFFSKEAIGT